MLDHPEKTPRLLAALRAAAPFEVKLVPSLIEHLQAENVVNTGRMHQVVRDLSYAGDEGGIMCHMSRSEETGRALVVFGRQRRRRRYSQNSRRRHPRGDGQPATRALA